MSPVPHSDSTSKLPLSPRMRSHINIQVLHLAVVATKCLLNFFDFYERYIFEMRMEPLDALVGRQSPSDILQPNLSPSPLDVDDDSL